VEKVCNNFKKIVSEGIECFVPHKILRKISDPEYYNKEVKRLKIRSERHIIEEN
jgi:hypothetical protein